jgi:hypothetical protein
MPIATPEAQAQIHRLTEYLSGGSAQANYERLRHYAETKTRRYILRSRWTSHSGEEFLHEAVRSCLTLRDDGRCERQIPTDVPLVAALKQIIKSKVEHAFQSVAFRRRGRPPTVTDESTGELKLVSEPTEQVWSAEGDRMTRQEREDAAKRIDGLIAFAQTDRVVHGMLLLVRDENLDKPATLVAERLGVSTDEVYVARKRLATLVGKYLKQAKEAK